MTDDPDLKSAYAIETPEDNLRLYRNWAESYDQTFVIDTGYRQPTLISARYLALGGQGTALDVGCGTGAVGDALPRDIPLDGIDISPDMMAVAEKKGRYGKLIQGDLLKQLPIPDATYQGLLSAGTFTHSHVGAAALPELIRILASGGVAVFSIRDQVWEKMGFAETFAKAIDQGQITAPERQPEKVYASAETAPEGHAEDVTYVTSFRRL